MQQDYLFNFWGSCLGFPLVFSFLRQLIYASYFLSFSSMFGVFVSFNVDILNFKGLVFVFLLEFSSKMNNIGMILLLSFMIVCFVLLQKWRSKNIQNKMKNENNLLFRFMCVLCCAACVVCAAWIRKGQDEDDKGEARGRRRRREGSLFVFVCVFSTLDVLVEFVITIKNIEHIAVLFVSYFCVSVFLTFLNEMR